MYYRIGWQIEIKKIEKLEQALGLFIIQILDLENSDINFIMGIKTRITVRLGSSNEKVELDVNN